MPTDNEPTTDRTDPRNIDTLRVDPDDVLEALKFNGQPPEYKNQRQAVLRVSPPFEAESAATIHYSEERTRYPPDMDPKPVHIRAFLFVGDDKPIGPGDEYSYPTRSENRAIAKEDHGEDVSEEMVDEYHETALDVWEGEVRKALREKIDLFKHAPGASHTVTVRYESED